VTGVSVKTARRGAGRVAGPLIGGLLAVLLAGCETSNSLTGGDATSAALAPQQPIQSKPVAFAPVIGAPAKVSAKLNEMLVATAGQKAVPVVPPKEAEYTVRGYLVAAPDPKGTKLSYIWDVSDKANKRKRIQGEELIEGKKGGDPWAAVDDAAMQRVATKAIDDISAFLPKGNGTAAADQSATAETSAQTSEPAQKPVVVASLDNNVPAAQPQARASRPVAGADGPVLAAQTPQAQPARPVQTAAAAPAPAVTAEPVALVPVVNGAPGDGSQSLTAAMRKHLQSAGVKLVDRASEGNTYTVKGSVEMGSAVDGQQPITIQWTVVDPSGKTLDKAVVQRNKVQEGSLDGPWGQIADLAAGEAAKSVAKLIVKPAG
jgi:hypothetical protein